MSFINFNLSQMQEPPFSKAAHGIKNLPAWFWRNRGWFRAIFMLVILAAVAIPTYAIFHHFGLKEGATIAQTLAAFAAIVIGAAWAYLAFVRNRQKYPRANTNLNVRELPLPNGKILLSVSTELENVGNVLVSVKNVRCSVHQVIPWPNEEVIANTIMSPSRDIGIEYEHGWECLDSREKQYERDELEIEPGEKDSISFDMVIPGNASLIRINTYIQNVSKRRQNELGWSRTLFHNVHRLP